MTRLTKTIKTDIKDLIQEKAINPKKKALEVKQREFLLKAFWSQISTYEYQAWKMLPKSLYFSVTCTTASLHIHDSTLGNIYVTFDKSFAYPRTMSIWMSYSDLSPDLKKEYKALIKEVSELEAYVSEVMTNLDVTLNSCTTVKKLRELWVNGAEIIDKALGQSQQSPTVHMPMVAIQTLDALVPLP